MHFQLVFSKEWLRTAVLQVISHIFVSGYVYMIPRSRDEMRAGIILMY